MDTMLVQVDPSLPRNVGQAWRVVPKPHAGRWLWQWKTGTLSPIADTILGQLGALEVSRFHAWDRSLCAWVLYA